MLRSFIFYEVVTTTNETRAVKLPRRERKLKRGREFKNSNFDFTVIQGTIET